MAGNSDRAVVRTGAAWHEWPMPTKIMPLLAGLAMTLSLCSEDEPSPAAAPERTGPAKPPKLSFAPVEKPDNFKVGVLTIEPDGYYVLPDKSELEIGLKNEGGPMLKVDLDFSAARDKAFPIEFLVNSKLLASQENPDESVSGTLPISESITDAQIAGAWPKTWMTDFTGKAEVTVELRAAGYEPAQLPIEVPLSDYYMRTWIRQSAEGGLRLVGEPKEPSEGTAAILIYNCVGSDRSAVFGEGRNLSDVDRVAIGTCVDTDQRRKCSYIGGKLDLIVQAAEVKIHDRRTGEVLATKQFPGFKSCPSKVVIEPGHTTYRGGVNPSGMIDWVAKETGYAKAEEAFGRFADK